MIEKVNPCHPDKIADRIAGAIVDLAYTKERDPKVAVEVLVGHGVCHIIMEASCVINANVSIHAPAGGATLRPRQGLRRGRSFNPRARGGRDSSDHKAAFQQICFNPRARGGRDVMHG